MEPALRIAEGTVARSQVVALAKDLEIAGDALSDVVALDGTVTVSGRVAGDLVVLSGDVRLGTGARVDGDLFVLGGSIHTEPGVEIGGRTVSYPSMSEAWLTLLEGPSLGLPASSPVVVGAKLALLTGWLLLVVVLFAIAGRDVVATSASVAAEPLPNFLVGTTAILCLFLTALFLTSLSASALGLPILFLVVLAALLLKLWGLVAVFHALGAWLSRRVLHRPMIPLNAAAAGLLVLGVCKLLPWVGLWTWTVATVVGVGAAVSTKFGRLQPWVRGLS